MINSTVSDLSTLRSAARGDLVVPRTRLQLGNRAFVWLVRSPGTVYHWTFVRYLRYQLSRVHTSPTICFQSTSNENCKEPLYMTLSMLLRLINCRFIIIIIIIIVFKIPEGTCIMKRNGN